MNIKAYFLLAVFLVAPGLGMEEQLIAQEVMGNPKFLIIKKQFEAINASVEIGGTSIWIRHSSIDWPGCSIYLQPTWLEVFEKVYIRTYSDWRKSKIVWLKYHLANSLQGLCIETLIKEYKNGNAKTIAGIARLPENLKEKILLLAGMI